ncbi:type II toxin-antitoxin system Phd/YefM family antitoxin [Thioalkalivibrio sp. ALMg13-2]|uniref:type II toxin-antitoxin system Phd/YefM family antitoxin n=1 Tax=Thioalkalivibrio sp. ALMg13-2 TaxID=1158167 RepID=UPI001E553D36|nr:type II toxin-antitoxin system prevent-host-death family antitoxin [Thioalkalivibrio sp. ALMg13-2]
MKEVSVREAREQLASILKEVAQGQEVSILRRGRRVARVVRPAADPPRFRSRAELRQSLPPTRFAKYKTPSVADVLCGYRRIPAFCRSEPASDANVSLSSPKRRSVISERVRVELPAVAVDSRRNRSGLGGLRASCAQRINRCLLGRVSFRPGG